MDTQKLIGFKPTEWKSRLICKILKARTFHYAWVLDVDYYGTMLLSESLGKGTSVTLLSRYKTGYFIFEMPDVPERSLYKTIGFHAKYGHTPYDMEVNFLSAAWFILKHYFKIVIPVIKNHTFNCQEWVCYMADCLNVKLIPDDQYPYCINLEKSPHLKLVKEV